MKKQKVISRQIFENEYAKLCKKFGIDVESIDVIQGNMQPSKKTKLGTNKVSIGVCLMH